MFQIKNQRQFLSRTLLSLFLACHCLSDESSAQAAEKHVTVQAVSNEDLVKALRAAKVVETNLDLSALKNGDELLITTERSPKFSDDEVKVQAVLIAKTAFDLLPQDIERSKIIFQNKGQETFCKVIVSRPLVNSYGHGEITKQALIKSLELEQEHDSGTNTLAVAAGPMQDDRLLQLSNINYLKAKGGDLKHAEELFAEQEKIAQTGDSTKVRDSLKTIWEIIREQRKALDASKQSGSIASQTKSTQLDANERQLGSPKHFVKGSNFALLLFLRSQKVDVDQEYNLLMQAREKNKEDALASRKQVHESLMLKFQKLPPEVQSKFSFAPSQSASEFPSTNLGRNQTSLQSSTKRSASSNGIQERRQTPYVPPN